MAITIVNAQPFATNNIIATTSLVQLHCSLGSFSLKLSSELIQAIEVIYRQQPKPAP